MNKPAAPSTIVSVDLGPLADHARNLVASGEFPSLDSLLQAALAAFESDRHDALTDAEHDALAAKYARRFDADGCRTYPIDEAFAMIREEIARRRPGADAA